ncbi:hypothetical protein M3Y95_00920500 [Aphelenchoides besseyi]|nr:hypothetical protein M3Y95_00920500 [Aphelenchoides besseyi]
MATNAHLLNQEFGDSDLCLNRYSLSWFSLILANVVIIVVLVQTTLDPLFTWMMVLPVICLLLTSGLFVGLKLQAKLAAAVYMTFTVPMFLGYLIVGFMFLFHGFNFHQFEFIDDNLVHNASIGLSLLHLIVVPIPLVITAYASLRVYREAKSYSKFSHLFSVCCGNHFF